ncbi:reverse transcriptase domain-containing protein [Tanacetum coccineum]
MHTRSQSHNLHHQQQQAPPVVVGPFNLEEPIENQALPLGPMADNQTMAQLLQAPTEGYEDYEEGHRPTTILQQDHFYDEVPERLEYVSKAYAFPIFPLEGQPAFGLKKKPPRSIQNRDILFSKFFNIFFPPSKTTNLQNEIMRFQQRFDETFYEAWDRFNDLLWACPHHGFSELHQLDTFYNALNSNDQDSLNSAAGGNFLDKMPCDCLRIIESKSKVRNSRNKPVVAKVSASTSTPGISSEVAELKDMFTKDMMPPTNNGSTEDIPPPVVPIVHHESIFEPVNALVSALRPNQKASIPFPSRRNDERNVGEMLTTKLRNL